MNDEAAAPKKCNRWLAPTVFFVLLVAVVLLGLLAMSIVERRQETARPVLVAAANIGEWESDSEVWGRNFPREYETYADTKIDDTKTVYGGAVPRDYLADLPYLKVLFAGYGFSKEYLQARGHAHTITDVTKTKRIKPDFMAATCWTCKSPDVPKLMHELTKKGEKLEKGAARFYASNFHKLKKKITHPIGCADCHDPKTMELVITRPSLKEGLKAMGRDIEKDKPTLQEMRSLVCAQCHVEYYFKTDPDSKKKSDPDNYKKNYLTSPWKNGTTVEAMIEYYDGIKGKDGKQFKDFTHGVSDTPIIKAQHPDYEMYKTGVHAYRKVSCADCHMPYRTEGGVKFTDHHVQSPLLNISASCAVCHRWSEDEIKTRVKSIQTKVATARKSAALALVDAHHDVAAAMKNHATDAQLAAARKLIRHGQFRWDYVAANNGMGFHSPQESMRVLGDARAQALQARLAISKLALPTTPTPAGGTQP